MSDWGKGATNNDIGWGQGANNEIGWGAIHALSYSGDTDIVGAAAADDRFIFTVKTDNAGTSASNQFTIPTSTTGITQAFNYDIETSDGQTITGLTGNHTITFPTAGTYEVRISGSFPYMFFNNGGDRLKMLDISNFGIYALGATSQSAAFRGCFNMTITATDSGNFGSVTNFSDAWRDCSSLTSFPLIDTSSGNTFSTTWFGCSSLTSFPLIETSSVTIFQFAWYNCSSLTSFPLLNTSSGTNFLSAWSLCSSLANYPANAFDTNIATNYTTAFNNTNLTTQSIDDILVSLDTSGVINGTFLQSGGQAPSATGEAAIDNLVAKGWTIVVTGGYEPIAAFPNWEDNNVDGSVFMAALNDYVPQTFNNTTNTFGSLSGTDKYVSGVLAPNGKIYGIPRSSTEVLEIDPVAQTTSLFGSLSGANKWYGGVLAPNGKIYGIPANSTEVLEIDPVTQTTTLFGSLGSGTDKWYGGVLAPNGKIYGIPFRSTQVLEIDPITQTTTLFGSLSGTLKWQGGVLSPNGKIYGIPRDSTQVLEIDPVNQTTTLFGSLSGSVKWAGGVLAPNGKIYGIPANSTEVLEIGDTNTQDEDFVLARYVNKL